MKTQIAFFKLILVTGLLFTTVLAVANTNPAKGTGTVTGETEKTIRSYFKFPQVLLPNYETKSIQTSRVEVLFTTNKDGQVNFVLAKTSNKKLKAEIEKQFANLMLEKVKQNVVHSVFLNFKTL